jgi:hypothetical protein
MLCSRYTSLEAAEAVLREAFQAGEGGDGWVCDEPLRGLGVSNRPFEVNETSRAPPQEAWGRLTVDLPPSAIDDHEAVYEDGEGLGSRAWLFPAILLNTPASMERDDLWAEEDD